MQLLRFKSDTKDLLLFEKDKQEFSDKAGPLFQIDDSGLNNFFQAENNPEFDIRSNGSYLSNKNSEAAKEKL